ncbi:MAG: serine/threonine protein kinase [Planctomycetes bacterium]|nr:serine/threonine protein kinase [Planctomycetota bacterium]
MPVPHPATGENLLFGILALQNDFVSREQLVAATAVWIGDKSRSLESILAEQQALDDDERQLLSALVRKHLANHGNDAEQSLRALSSVDSSVKNELTRLNDSLVTRSVAQVSLDRRGEGNDSAYATRPPAATELTKAGLRFRVLRPHARGGLGQVSVALDSELPREVAFKELLDEHADSLSKRGRFLMEAQITGALEHPGIVPVYGLGHYADGRPFYAMRFIQGDSLKEAIAAYHKPAARRGDRGERALQLRKLLARFIDVCDAIDYAHSRGVLHRDLKPGNIMLGKYGETLVVDWGLAKTVGRDSRDSDERPLGVSRKEESDETVMGSIIGTPAFMPPEQADGRHDLLGPASDVYSLGATLYCLLTGAPPFPDEGLETTLSRVRRGDFPRPREMDRRIPRPLESICLRAMALRPQDRYPSTRELAEDVEHWLADEPVEAHREGAAERTGRWMRRHRSWTMAGAAALVLVAAVSSISAFVVNAAWREEANLRALAEETREFDVRLLQARAGEDVFEESAVRSLDAQLNRIAALPVAEAAGQADLRRRQLLDAYVASMHRSLEKSPFTDEDREQFDRRLETLQSVFRDGPSDRMAAASEDLIRRRDSRLTQWDPLLDLQPPIPSTKVSESFGADIVVDNGGVRMGRSAGEEFAWVDTGAACPPGNIELAEEFDLSWKSAPAVGIALNHDGEQGYEFYVAAPAFQPRGDAAFEVGRLPSMGEELSRLDDRQLFMLVARNGELMRRASLPALDGPLRMTARREGAKLTLLVNDIHRVEVEDPFPLPAASPGRYAVFWPRSTYLERLTARRQRAARLPTPIEEADQLYAQGYFSDAQKIYDRLDSTEAKYKSGLCRYWLNPDDYLQVMKAVADESPEEAAQWWLLANVRLMKEYANQGNRELFRQRLGRIASRFDLADAARLLPASERQTLFEDIRRIGQRYRIAVAPQGDIEDLQLAVELDGAFNEDVHQRRTTRWRLADAYRVAAVVRNDPSLFENAKEILRDLTLDKPDELPVPPRERAAIVSDLAWVLIVEEKNDEARREIEQWLLDAEGNVQPDYASLLVDRARLAYLEGDVEAATRDLEDFLRRAEEDLDRISHAEYSAARLLRGMIHEDRGEYDQARENFLAASYRNWRGGAPAPAEYADASGVEMVRLTDSYNYDSVATSWTDELTADEAYRRVLSLAAGGGMRSLTIDKVVKTAVPRELMREVSVGMYQGERGRRLGRETVLRKLSLRAVHIEAAQQMIFLGVMKSAFAGETPTPEEEQFIYSQCIEIVDAFDAKQIDDRDMVSILEFWQGTGSFTKWERLAARLEPRLAASMSYLFGRMHMLHGKTESAKRFLRYALEHPAVNSITRDWARRDLKQIEMMKPPAG